MLFPSAAPRRRRRQGSRLILKATPVDSSGYTFNRAGVAHYRNSNGRLVAAGSGILRSLHHVNNRFNFFVEGGLRTNGWTFSEDLTQAIWTKTAGAVTGNHSNDPALTGSADIFIPTATTAVHSIGRPAPATPTNATPQSISVFACAFGYSWLCIETIDKAAVTRRTWINLSNGALGTTNAGHTVQTTPYNESNPFYHIELAVDAGTGAGTFQVNFIVANADNVTSFLANGTGGILLWGAQFELDQGWPSSYIVTGAGTASRVVDEMAFTLNEPFLAMSVYMRMVDRRVNGYFEAGNTTVPFAVSATNAAPWMRIARSGGGGQNWIPAGNLASGSPFAGAGTPDANHELRLSHNVTNRSVTGAASINEGAESANTTAANATGEGTVTKLYIGDHGTITGAANVVFDRLAILGKEGATFAEFRGMFA